MNLFKTAIAPGHAYIQRCVDAAVAQATVKAQSELPPTPPHRHDSEGLSTRNIQSDPLADWYLNNFSKMPPKQIDSILRMGLSGNIWQCVQLTQSMRDSWPVFRKCEMELRSAIASANFVVHPYALPGQKPTKSAEEKADLVRRAITSFKPDRFADEDGFNGMVYDLTDSICNGVSIVEMIWNENAKDPNGKRESLVRTAAWVHPRNYAFTADGRVGVQYAAESGGMSFSNQTKLDFQDNPSKYLVAKFKSKSGSFLGAGLMRTLAKIWVMVMYPRDYALMFAQKYGNPFLDISYQAGLSGNPAEVAKFEKLARQAAASGYFVHPDTAKLEIGKEHNMGSENAHMTLMRLADEQCQILMLGQTLTTSTPHKSGSRAQGEVHEDVLAQKIEAYTKWIAEILTEQFAESILVENYGDSFERPLIEADMTRPMTAKEQAEYLVNISKSKVPLISSEVYQRAGHQEPSPGDKTLIEGSLTILEEPLTPTEQAEKDFEMQLEQQEAIQSIAPEQPPTSGNVEAKLAELLSKKSIKAALRKASEKDVLELEQLITAAETATHLNGEAKAVELKIRHLLSNHRK